jgi:2-polyprenyl-3-methyl-5-hydroxy-6-metoxy-1,4-benzoquinol methylase
MFWKCPLCHGSLDTGANSLTCPACARDYPVVAELPDFRIENQAWIDFDEDRARALAVDQLIRAEGLEAGIHNVFEISRKFSPEKCRFRTRQVLAGIDKYDGQLDGWLDATTRMPILEVGVGPGQMTCALARRGIAVHGIDVSIEWLVVAKHWLHSLGMEPSLAVAMAETLPVADRTVASYVSLDVIEHVGDKDRLVSEMARVLQPGGRYALVTPNRFSLSPEPHVGVWGVGYLPRRLQGWWVRRMAGVSYDYFWLLSTTETRRLFRRAASLTPDIDFPEIDVAEIRLFPPFKARLARLYNWVIRAPILRLTAPVMGTYFRVTGSAPIDVAAIRDRA